MAVALAVAGVSAADPAISLRGSPPPGMWADAAIGSAGEWATAADPDRSAAALVASLANARDAEEEFDLDSALSFYLETCLAGPPDCEAALWASACADAARVAFGMGDAGAVQQALGILLTVDPGHDLTGARFPPEIARRAAQITSELPRGDIRILGNAIGVSLDGRRVGAAPITIAGLPAGEHRLECNGWQQRIPLRAGETVEVTCPVPSQVSEIRLGMAQMAGQGLVWMQVPTGDWGMDSGIWVFSTEQGVTGVRVHEPGAESRVWEEAAAGARLR